MYRHSERVNSTSEKYLSILKRATQSRISARYKLARNQGFLFSNSCRYC